MTLPASGRIAMNEVNIELGQSSTGLISLNDANVRSLAGVPSGRIALSDLYGKSALPSFFITSAIINVQWDLAVNPGGFANCFITLDMSFVVDGSGNLFFKFTRSNGPQNVRNVRFNSTNINNPTTAIQFGSGLTPVASGNPITQIAVRSKVNPPAPTFSASGSFNSFANLQMNFPSFGQDGQARFNSGGAFSTVYNPVTGNFNYGTPNNDNTFYTMSFEAQKNGTASGLTQLTYVNDPIEVYVVADPTIKCTINQIAMAGF